MGVIVWSRGRRGAGGGWRRRAAQPTWRRRRTRGSRRGPCGRGPPPRRRPRRPPTARRRRSPSATVSGRRPPASSTRWRRVRSPTRVQSNGTPPPGVGASRSTTSAPWRSTSLSCGSPAASARMRTGTRSCTARLVWGVSEPCSWTARSPTASTVSTTSRTRWSRNTPTVSTWSGTAATISRASSASTWRREGAKIMPMASAPASTAASASAAEVIPQIFTNTVRDRTGVPAGCSASWRSPVPGASRVGRARREATAAAGSPEVTSDSPTRTAS